MAVTITSATEAQFSTFLTTYCYTVPETERAKLLALSHIFLCSLPFCEGAELDADKVAQAQMFLAYSMSECGGGFNPASFAYSDSTTDETAGGRLTEKSLGRGAIVKKYEYDSSTTTTSGSAGIAGLTPFQTLQRANAIAFGLLAPFLCEHQNDDDGMGCPAVLLV